MVVALWLVMDVVVKDASSSGSLGSLGSLRGGRRVLLRLTGDWLVGENCWKICLSVSSSNCGVRCGVSGARGNMGVVEKPGGVGSITRV